MKAALLGGAALSLLTVSAFGADLEPLAPLPPPPPPFAWSGCFAGGHAGYGSARKDITDPIQLAQDAVLGAGTTVGVTTVGVSPTGAVLGGQVGCDYEFAARWVIGLEASVSASTMKGTTTVGFPAGFPGDQGLVNARTDFLPSVTARFGYDFDRVLLYVRGGAAWAGDQYTVSGSITGTAFNFQAIDTRNGWVAGGGIDWAFSGPWSVNFEYDYYQFGNGNVVMTDSINAFVGQVNVKQSVQVVKLGLNFHVWSWDQW